MESDRHIFLGALGQIISVNTRVMILFGVRLSWKANSNQLDGNQMGWFPCLCMYHRLYVGQFHLSLLTSKTS